MKGNTSVSGRKTTPKNAVAAEHDYNCSKRNELIPILDSNPDTLVRPDVTEHKGDITLAHVQNSIAALINERSHNLEAMISKNTVNTEALKNSTDFMFLKVEFLKISSKQLEPPVRRTTAGCFK